MDLLDTDRVGNSDRDRDRMDGDSDGSGTVFISRDARSALYLFSSYDESHRPRGSWVRLRNQSEGWAKTRRKTGFKSSWFDHPLNPQWA